MQFGVFDHMDRACPNLGRFFDERLRFVDLLDQSGFARYHIAEHHATPLGMSPSPSVYLAAVAQRSTRLRFGPMVYAMPLYHPLRLAEEICMLDQMSGGRLDIGFGRGASTIEASYFGWEPEDMQSAYEEGMEIVLKALTSGHLTHEGTHYTFNDVRLCLEPVQRPHPPLWYGVHSTESAQRAAKGGLNIISLDNAHDTRAFVDSFNRTWNRTENVTRTKPLAGISYFIVVAEESEEALSVARRAYPVWHNSFYFLTRKHGSQPRHQRPPQFDGIMSESRAIAGTPSEVSNFLAQSIAVSGIDYIVAQFAFGDQTFDEIARSVRLFADHIMPKFIT